MTGPERPIELGEVASVVENSRIGRAVLAFASTLAAGLKSSRLMRVFHAARDARVGVAPTRMFASGGLIVAIAMVVHLLLLAKEPYAYPSRAAMLLPLVVLGASVLCILLRESLARGLNDRRQRHE